ncbi:molybdenum cofactor guanylyltransferase MobA [Limnohabitans sp. Jir72]|uniref:molybdenum cofactor guanylyltransferase MobA n=1 Tax=Limnohabitans sp. Jir72 TaxID=1977909 RepID=UPI000D3679C3|nr:molybdenum cofactor guanylyltransferase MobA [Limnohabitans sp. Jir72]PUE28035.1 molybdenum cofactor guanylyltransferase MobA [Limnohabitans sp. Jir72]
MTVHLPAITGLILAGGRGSRMGGVDKGLQNFRGLPLALQTLMRLQMQSLPVQEILINANRNLSAYESLGVPVWPDSIDGYAGPLAGFLTGLERCETPLLLTVPCDSPLFPLDLLERLAQALHEQDADLAMATAPETDGQIRAQPVFCLLKVSLLESLVKFTQSGGRKIDAWTAEHRCALVAFNQPGDDPHAFANANTLQELLQLESI